MVPAELPNKAKMQKGQHRPIPYLEGYQHVQMLTVPTILSNS
jgi:hypothetical protein